VKNIQASGIQGPFAAKITQLRIAKGLHKSKISGVSASLMYKIENEDRIPRNTTIGMLAKALNDGSPDLQQQLTDLADKQRGNKQVVEVETDSEETSDPYISFVDIAKQGSAPSLKSVKQVQEAVQNYMKILMAQFDGVFAERGIDPKQEKLRKKELANLQSRILKDERFPQHGIPWLTKFQKCKLGGKPHNVSATEIAELLLNGNQSANLMEFIGLPSTDL
jgi:transcriptional regulator with XRE-family HTH domain